MFTKINRLVVLLVILTGSTSMLIAEHVILIHGLARTASSMGRIESRLLEESYNVVNIDYPSREFEIPQLARYVRQKIEENTQDSKRIHIVTHSMGGIIVRQIQNTEPIHNLGRVVMLSPPNQGSEIVDKLSHLSLFKKINGPAGTQLGTNKNSFVRGLGPVNFDLGIITGCRTVNPILSLMIPGKDDGKVSTNSAQVAGMRDYLVVPSSHTFIMRNSHAIEEVIYFLEHSRFRK